MLYNNVENNNRRNHNAQHHQNKTIKKISNFILISSISQSTLDEKRLKWRTTNSIVNIISFQGTQEINTIKIAQKRNSEKDIKLRTSKIPIRVPSPNSYK